MPRAFIVDSVEVRGPLVRRARFSFHAGKVREWNFYFYAPSLVFIVTLVECAIEKDGGFDRHGGVLGSLFPFGFSVGSKDGVKNRIGRIYLQLYIVLSVGSRVQKEFDDVGFPKGVIPICKGARDVFVFKVEPKVNVGVVR